MRKLVTALCALVFLLSCDDELKLVSRDFSVTLKSIDVGTAVVGKPVNCTLTISDLDPDNGDQILTRFEVRDWDGVILVDNNEYSPGETFEYDFKANNRLDFDFIPATEGEAYIVMGVASELVTRSDSIKLKVSSPEINIRFRNVPDLMLVSEEAEFYLQLDTELYGVKASARFVKGSGGYIFPGMMRQGARAWHWKKQPGDVPAGCDRTGGDRVYRFKPLRSASERECNDTSKSMKI
ncbi:hypothetical protein [Parabacteroides merdae]|uniref:hypothetical protein n=1 Tax=Parabacteroides merdae TaxID=46503 RepID=UPI00209856B1|nr:hypothetical protein [Parabacteroides merdae]MCO7170427.1 hypothetical protein [Parabacteroides merdae]